MVSQHVSGIFMAIVRRSDCVPLPIVVCPVVAIVMLESRVVRCVHCVENVAWLSSGNILHTVFLVHTNSIHIFLVMLSSYQLPLQISRPNFLLHFFSLMCIINTVLIILRGFLMTYLWFHAVRMAKRCLCGRAVCWSTVASELFVLQL